jgi:hypothetical protein
MASGEYDDCKNAQGIGESMQLILCILYYLRWCGFSNLNSFISRNMEKFLNIILSRVAHSIQDGAVKP